MTPEEIEILANLMRGREMTGTQVAKCLVETHLALVQAKSEIRKLRRTPKAAAKTQSDNSLLRSELAATKETLKFAVKRNEVLREKLVRALGGRDHGSRPNYALSKKEVAK